VISVCRVGLEVTKINLVTKITTHLPILVYSHDEQRFMFFRTMIICTSASKCTKLDQETDERRQDRKENVKKKVKIKKGVEKVQPLFII